MGKYDKHSYHQLRRMYGFTPDEDKNEVSERIMNHHKFMVERITKRQHPNWLAGERKAAVFKRIYRNNFSRDEMERIKVSLIPFHQSIEKNVL